MESTELAYIGLRLASGAVAAVLAIVLWSRTRDGAWMFVVLAVVASYIDIVYSILELFGITKGIFPLIGLGAVSVDVLKMIFSCLPTFLFIFAFALMIARRKRFRSDILIKPPASAKLTP